MPTFPPGAIPVPAIRVDWNLLDRLKEYGQTKPCLDSSPWGPRLAKNATYIRAPGNKPAPGLRRGPNRDALEAFQHQNDTIAVASSVATAKAGIVGNPHTPITQP